MRIGLLSGSVSRTGGGVFEAVIAHARLLRSLGHQPVAFGLEDEHSAADRERFDGMAVITRRRRGPRTIAYAPGLTRALIDADLDLLHLHGIWQYPSRAATGWARRTGRPYLISPHGMLDPWITARGRLKKRVALMLYERASWRRADLFHALTEAEARDIGAQTGGAPTAIIPNAIRAPMVADAEPDPAAGGQRYLLYLSRIHPKKNVDALAQAWTVARAWTGDRAHRLLLCGWGDAEHVAAFEAKLAAIGDPTIAFLGPVFGARKDRLLAHARFVVLASLSEGLPMAILEAWAAGAPTLMSRGCNLDIGFARGAARDCGTAVETIAAALADALTMRDGEHAAMRAAALALAAERFSPERIADDWAGLYASLAGEARA